MQVNGWLLDVRLQGDEAWLWVKTGKERVKLRYTYHPELYVIPQKVSNEQFMDIFDEHPNISFIKTMERYTSLGETEKKLVLKVIIESLEQYQSVFRLVEKYGEVFDGDLSHTQRFLADNGLIPFGEMTAEVDERFMIQSLVGVPSDLRVQPPPFKVLCFELYSYDNEISFVTFDEELREEYLFSGSELETLKEFLHYIEKYDPDLVSCLERDMKKLLKLCLKYQQPSLGFYHKSFHLKKGRVFIGLHLYRRTSLAGIVERIMYTREVPRVSSEYAAGRAIESRQCYEARKLGYLIPRRSFYQPVMSLRELLRDRDHGALIFAPNVGLHENVAALDFESMFPHLILKENISYENVRSRRESEGFLLGFTQDTIQRRLYFKHHRKELMEKAQEWFWCETRQQALKEILFCTYGYSGCWANKFGNMDTFMEINKAARLKLVAALNIARGEGFHTLYGNSDSLFVQKFGASHLDFDDLAGLINEKLGLPITVENHFKYLVLLPQKSGEDFGAINR